MKTADKLIECIPYFLAIILFGYSLCYLLYSYLVKKGSFKPRDVFERHYSMENRINPRNLERHIYDTCQGDFLKMLNYITQKLVSIESSDYMKLFPNPNYIFDGDIKLIAKRIHEEYKL